MGKSGEKRESGSQPQKPDLLCRVNNPIPKSQWKSYEHFRLMWMLSHGFNLTDLAICLGNVIQDQLEELKLESPNMLVKDLPQFDMEKIFDQWVMDSGFGGEIWPCFREYLDCEYEYGIGTKEEV